LGDHANVYVVEQFDSARGIYLYTHYGYQQLPADLQFALRGSRERWRYSSDMAQIILRAMMRRDPDSLENFGISATCLNAREYVLMVDVQRQYIGRGRFCRAAQLAEQLGMDPCWTFEEFLKLDPEHVWEMW
jgi:hypothetical protein